MTVAESGKGGSNRERTFFMRYPLVLLWMVSAIVIMLLSACSGGAPSSQSGDERSATAITENESGNGIDDEASTNVNATGEKETPNGTGTDQETSEATVAVTGSGEDTVAAALPGLKPSGEPLVIGFTMDTLLEERWKKDRDLFVEAAEKLGAKVVVKSANGDDARQIAQAETMISQGVDVLVIVPHNAEATAAIVAKAHKAGIKVLSYDRLVTNADVDLYVSFDNIEVGRLQAEAILKLVPKGNYVYIGGADTDNNARQFKEGAFNALQRSINRGDIRVVYDQWSKDWKPVYALENMQEALAANGAAGIDAVIVANDATAGSAVQVLAEHGLAGRIPVAGQDADLAAIRRIVAGTQTMTVYKPIGRLAEQTAQLAIALAKGEQPVTTRRVNNGKIEVPSILLPPIAVDASNIDKTVIADGFHTREEVYGAAGE
ncbi:D-xylose ABC transporter substrate-binding protein [Saccharibacillus sacchari]|uniref:D-xylose ABC transporter substrate-binding protein n=1 Tax=Saccharibacillus sacchari TaxID=456493 RepID=A0ACC6PHG5_9BACL